MCCSSTSDLYQTVGYEITKVSDNSTLIPRTSFGSTTPLTEGFVAEINNVECVSGAGCEIDWDRTGYVANQGAQNVIYDLNPQTLEGYSTNWQAYVRPDTTASFSPSPHDFELVWVSESDSLYRLPGYSAFCARAYRCSPSMQQTIRWPIY